MPLIPAYSALVIGIVCAIGIAVAGQPEFAPLFLMVAVVAVVVILVGRWRGWYR